MALPYELYLIQIEAKIMVIVTENMFAWVICMPMQLRQSIIWLTQVISLAKNPCLETMDPTYNDANAPKRLDKDHICGRLKSLLCTKDLVRRLFQCFSCIPKVPWRALTIRNSSEALSLNPSFQAQYGFLTILQQIFLCSQAWSKIWKDFEDSEHSEDRLSIDESAAKICAMKGVFGNYFDDLQKVFVLLAVAYSHSWFEYRILGRMEIMRHNAQGSFGRDQSEQIWLLDDEI